jgi:hypothetical protein
MSAGDIHQNDIGTVFEVTLKDGSSIVNISASTVKQIVFQDPAGVKRTKSASFTTTGTDGKIRYVTVMGDLNLVGKWNLQAYVEMPSGKWHSDISKFVVYPNIV